MAELYVVKQGECLARIARRYGFRSHLALYDHPDNAALRAQRPDPNVLYPGDVVVIPTRNDRAAEVATTAVHSFRLHLPRKVLRVRLVDADGTARRGVAVEVSLDGAASPCVTDAQGGIEIDVPRGTTRARLRVDGRDLTLDLGHLDPAREAPDNGEAGARGRLANLGYCVETAAAYATALRLFQRDEALPETGALDDATRDALLARHGA